MRLALSAPRRCIGVIQQRLQVRSQCARDRQERIELRVAEAGFELLQLPHADPRAVRDLFLRKARAERQPPFPDRHAERASRAIADSHSGIVMQTAVYGPRSVDHVLQFVSTGVA